MRKQIDAPPDERPERFRAVARGASDENRRESGKREDEQADRSRGHEREGHERA
jgi:hypothetical protein